MAAGWSGACPKVSLSGCLRRSTMARFFFHTNLPSEQNIQDDEGFEFATIHEAKCQAVVYAGSLLRDSAQTFWDSGDFELTVTDDHGLSCLRCASWRLKRPLFGR